MMNISTGTAAGLLQDALTLPDGQHPHISASKIHMLTKCGLFTNQANAGQHLKLGLAEVTDVVEKITYVPDLTDMADLIFRASVIQSRQNPVYSLGGELLREQAGIDYTLDSDDPLFLGGIEGVWAISEENADYLVEHGGLLLATTKGFVTPGAVRTVVGWELIEGSTRRYLHTEPAPAEVQEFLGNGIWIDVPGGSESGILVDEI